MNYSLLLFTVPLFLLSCKEETQSATEKPNIEPTENKNVDSTRVDSTGIDSTTIESYQPGDSARILIDELNLCSEYSLEDTFCYRKYYFQFYSLSKNNDFSCFLLVAPGGSGGESISVYKKTKEGYQKLNSYFAFYGKVKTSGNKDYKDIVLSHKRYTDYSVLYLEVLYTWNGVEYEFEDLISLNNTPFDLLATIGVIKDKKVKKPPFYEEAGDYTLVSDGDYTIDTLRKGSIWNLLEIKSFHETWWVYEEYQEYELLKKKENY